MKKVILVVAVLFSIYLKAQDSKKYLKDTSKWILKIGGNIVDNSGDASPSNTFKNVDEMAFSNIPLKLNFEYRFSEFLGFEISSSINQWKASKGVIDRILLTKDQNYFAVDAHLKIYYDQALNWFLKAHWMDLYLNAGAGYFEINQGATTLNLGPGATFWVSKNIGLSFDAIAKLTTDSSPIQFDTNHIQYSLGLTYRFQNKGEKGEDSDGDGVLDEFDFCPNLAGEKELSGCPSNDKNNLETKKKESRENNFLDSDKDGILDNADQCPEIVGAPSNKGCPLQDKDNDGVLDSADQCPEIVGEPSNNGCPFADKDKDGVLDSADQCPEIVGDPSNKGCPISSSNSLISDSSSENSLEGEEITSSLKVLSDRIKFESGNYNFTQDSYPILKKLVALLKKNPNVKYIIVGHTDSVGSYSRNRELSKTRANAVRNYLVDSGYPKENLGAKGLGESKPIDTNFTKQGRENNRRVEFVKIKK